MTEHVRVERKGGELAIVLARPDRRNALTVAMYEALAEAFERARDDNSIRVITIRAEGQDFAAGNDIGDFLDARPRETDEIPVWRLLRSLATCETPIVAAVHGNCVGIGTTLLAGRYSSPLTISFKAIRASLFANAMATSFGGLRAMISLS